MPICTFHNLFMILGMYVAVYMICAVKVAMTNRRKSIPIIRFIALFFVFPVILSWNAIVVIICIIFFLIINFFSFLWYGVEGEDYREAFKSNLDIKLWFKIAHDDFMGKLQW